jgi:type 1 glutamine amidotransferase
MAQRPGSFLRDWRALQLICVTMLTWLGSPGIVAAQTPRVLFLTTVETDRAHRHDSLEHAGAVLTTLGQTSGAFTVVASEDVAMLNPASLATFDAVIFFTAGELPVTDTQKAALLAFVAGGKGFIGVHSATNTFYQWPEYGRLIGGYMANHPWAGIPTTLRVEDTSHPSTAHFGSSVTITDEIYEFRDWSRDNVHVLLSVDTTSVPPAGNRTDNDYAVAWTRRYGAGRVFYSALGHSIAIWDDTRFRQHMLGGIRWALGQDVDNDGLSTDWELAFGLNPNVATAADGPTGDPDGDHISNAAEQQAGTHPRGFFQRYLSEGALNAFFDLRLALLNVGASPAHVQLRYLQPGGVVATHAETLSPLRRRTLVRSDFAAIASNEFSTLVESDQPVVVDRTMTWGVGGYGSHAETAVDQPSTQWYLAEGATWGDMSLFYLLQNPNPTATTATIRYLLPGGVAPIVRTYSLPPQSRTTIPVDDETPALASTDVSAEITALQPIIVERAMYRSLPGQPWAAGQGSTGVTATNTRWFLAEGATGSFFDLFILLANPSPTAANVRVTYLLTGGGQLVKDYGVPANSRATIFVDAEEFPGPGGSRLLAETSVSAIVESTNNVAIVVERTMWWPGPLVSSQVWTEAHNSAGATAVGTRWALAEGEVGGPDGAETYVLIANTASRAGRARVTLYFEDGTSAVTETPLEPNSRTTVGVRVTFPAANNRRFSAIVESLTADLTVDPVPIVVERAMYTSPGGVTWAAGTNALATRLH